MATLPGAWRYRVSTGTGRPGVSILWLGEVESLICSFYLSVAARRIVWADPSLRYTSMLLGCYLSNQQTNCWGRGEGGGENVYGFVFVCVCGCVCICCVFCTCLCKCLGEYVCELGSKRESGEGEREWERESEWSCIFCMCVLERESDHVSSVCVYWRERERVIMYLLYVFIGERERESDHVSSVCV